MPQNVRLFFSGLIAALSLLAVVPLVTELTRPRDIWWTPRTLLVPLGESRDRVVIYVRGRLLTELLEAGTLQIAGVSGQSVVLPSEIGLRLNNWDRVRGQRVPLLLAYAWAAGAMATLFVLVLTGRLAYRPEKAPRQAP